MLALLGPIAAGEARAYPDAWLPTGYTATIFADDLFEPRGMALATCTGGGQHLLVIERGDVSRVTALWDEDGDGASGAGERAVIADSASGLNHGIALYNGYLFASSDTEVYRWPYQACQKTKVGAHITVVVNMNADGRGGAPRGHKTRTLAFSPTGRLFISVGSYANVDDDDERSRIRYVDGVASSDDPAAAEFLSLPTHATGLRNEVGLAFDADNVLWGVENGADNLYRADLGGRIHNDNPGEELNRFGGADFVEGDFYGYPQCWSEYKLSQHSDRAGGAGTQWAWPSFMPDTTDEWCRENAVPPMLVMQV